MAHKKTIYIFGHTHPDTDSICSAIVYAHFLKERHKHNVVPARIGELNPETKFVLKKWGVKIPVLLRDATGKNVIIVDHNEIDISAKNVRHANILEIIDHHRIGDVETIHPIPFENEPRGATAAIIADRFSWFRIPIPRKIAGLIVSAILSDTVLLKSPTTIPKDRVLVRKLAKIARIDIQKYGHAMLEAGCDVLNHTARQLILGDFKTYRHGDTKVGVGQVPVIGFDTIMERKEELLRALVQYQKRNYIATFLMVTDVIATNTYLFFAGDEEKVKKLFHKKIEKFAGLSGGIMYLPKVVSRKAQIQPKVLKLLK
ncbi:manganese-dependent inorganic pyrophosphatase [Candidatus Woesearchaeota archaeon]|jgi:manganese-dependent inorganic pyrophosphatase|nr:manganese-dependent inorganic pyrophosphatase [Candidatus Woesearchaeota archaeon]MBT5397079.1 manganese-dependent inorganic pyrophosphatase [Candidatus Woesearchaeota archaeon]MBT6367375.1 manganese-dependent inorganic pyrophosphatase [Candidatus Woesearchaeota archaeon]MBT7762479.1 manganese-dependent inorganic pyrophosphatase [Candidatus Woesearchaeota archaeon]